MGPQVKVKMGTAVFATSWGERLSLFGKALDDRLVVVTLIELMKVSDHQDLTSFFLPEGNRHRGDSVAADYIIRCVVQVDSAAALICSSARIRKGDL